MRSASRLFAVMLMTSMMIVLSASARAELTTPTLSPANWMTNGPVHAMARTSSTIYIGGAFTRVGPYAGNAVPVDTATGRTRPVFPRAEGVVNACTPDGSGGWYIGGKFTRVGGTPRNRLAHIRPSGRLDMQWDPGADGTVNCITLAGDRIYIGGEFTRVGGADLKYVAALDRKTGRAIDTWNPNPDSYVHFVKVSDSAVYIGGPFKKVGSWARPSGLAAVTPEVGNVILAWNPPLTGYANDLLVMGSKLYAGGSFTAKDAAGTTSGLFVLNPSTGALVPGSPIFSGMVASFALAGPKILVGGGFGTVDGQQRRGLAALDASTGSLLDWTPDAYVGGFVLKLAVTGSTVYMSGMAMSIKGRISLNDPYEYLAAFDTESGELSPWRPDVDGLVNTLGVWGSTVYLGGEFNFVNALTRNRLAAFNVSTGNILDWDPNANNSVYSLAVANGMVYAGGAFTSVHFSTHSRLAAIDGVTGAVSSWPANANDIVQTMAISSSTLYLGGSFTKVNGVDRNHLAAISLSKAGSLQPWNPNSDGSVATVATSGGVIYVGGAFSTTGGQARNNLAALDPESGAATDWNPNANDFVSALAMAAGKVFAGGRFSRIGGQARIKLATLDPVSGAATAWTANIPPELGEVYALSACENKVYVGGDHLAVVDLSTSDTIMMDTESMTDSHIRYTALIASHDTLYASGNFTSIYGEPHRYFACFDLTRPGELEPAYDTLDYLEGTRYAVDVVRGGTPTTRTLSFKNIGERPVNFTNGDPATPGFTVQGRRAEDFSIIKVEPPSSAPLAPGASIKVTVRFAPTEATRTLGLDAELLVTCDSPLSQEFMVPLFGDAVPVELSGFTVD